MIYVKSSLESYRTHGDRDVKVLGPVVLLEGVDIIPDLRTHADGQLKMRSLEDIELYHAFKVFLLPHYYQEGRP